MLRSVSNGARFQLKFARETKDETKETQRGGVACVRRRIAICQSRCGRSRKRCRVIVVRALLSSFVTSVSFDENIRKDTEPVRGRGRDSGRASVSGCHGYRVAPCCDVGAEDEQEDGVRERGVERESLRSLHDHFPAADPGGFQCAH